MASPGGLKREACWPGRMVRADGQGRGLVWEGVLLTPSCVQRRKEMSHILGPNPSPALSTHAGQEEQSRDHLPHCESLKHPVCVPPRVIGTPFYLMEYCPGLIYKDPSLPGLEANQRRAIYTAMNRVLCKIHSVDLDTAGLGDYGRQGELEAARLSC